MRFIKVKDNIVSNYSLEQLLVDHPNAEIYSRTQLPDPNLLKNYDVYPLVTTPVPTEEYIVVIGEGDPEFKDGEWYQTWLSRPMTEEEISVEQEKRQCALSQPAVTTAAQ